MAYHVYKIDYKSLSEDRASADKCIEAQAIADKMHKETGDHYVVVWVTSVWTTQTIDDVLRKESFRAR